MRESDDSKKTVRNSMGPFIFMLLRFTVPMVALFAYYLALYFVSSSVVQQVVGLQAALVGAANRHACTREMLMNLRRDLMTYGDREFMRTRYATIGDSRSCVLYHQALLMYGPPEGEELRGSYAEFVPVYESGTVSFFTPAENSNLFSAQHSDVCPWVATANDAFPPFGPTVWPGTLEQCRAFSSNLLTRGLDAAAHVYLTRGDAMAQRRMRARLYSVPKDARTGLGVILPAATYNFSEDAGTWQGAASTESLAAAASGGQDPPPFPLASFLGDIDDPVAFWATAPNNTQNYSIAAEFQGPDMQWLVQMSHLFLVPGFNHLTTFYVSARREHQLVRQSSPPNSPTRSYLPTPPPHTHTHTRPFFSSTRGSQPSNGWPTLSPCSPPAFIVCS